MVLEIKSSTVHPRRSAPVVMTSREQPAAKLCCLNFFFTDFSSRSLVLLEGRISAVAPDETGQFVGGKEHLFHLMHRLDVHRQPVAVAAHRVDEVLVRAALSQQLRRLDAVLVGVLLKVDVVEQAHVAPEIHVLAVAQLLGVPSA